MVIAKPTPSCLDGDHYSLDTGAVWNVLQVSEQCTVVAKCLAFVSSGITMSFPYPCQKASFFPFFPVIYCSIMP